ncbi:MAG: Gfo/Idh/MocA family oxidoreductase [Clostridium sp.]|jgi:predicted dehydrogenase|uniref:Gfo/Idh/MocA family protein n=1 Tax=Clostridium sp. TaxID=1506 RepID=UPI0025BC5399|nr:Gfo/Idh/MocA family oxidoreductase [Clostridium sp.]MCH3964804.1 Gfo/Idh/MocA family oxidoreductase [Clostridium sp.]MCI1715275.1 Gfo/Idh/MocA family oxidoreductase [Clostridium sp.]MCI1799537.1 Gfo/Idh/MocA family oxidoreductase [Clostridium sp.]MCI1813458.1 Gfo/Idh/MocA family oxidoreductase [Clostridium sp.]MCI1870349.1 Gfo/Idh/MocA family oxidoreductase [Clostridium sp.]
MREIKIGLIGAGWMGSYHAIGFTNIRRAYGDSICPVFEMVADSNEKTAKKACSRFGFKNFTTDWKKVIENPEIELVIIATPNNLHAPIVIAAAKAGKHIICEKPMANTLQDSKAMAEAVKKAGVKSLVDFIYRKCPANVYARDIIRAGKLGEIITYRGEFDCSYCVDPLVPSTWRQYASIAGTGVLGDLTAHVISLSDMLVGKEVEAVCAMWETVYPTRPESINSSKRVVVDTDDQVYALIKYSDGHIGQMSSSRISAGKPCALAYEIQGTKGTIKFDLTRINEIKLYDGNKSEAGDSGFKILKGNVDHGDYKSFCETDELGISYADVMGIQAHDMLEAIVNDKNIDIDIPYGYYVDRVMAAMSESARTGKWVKVSDSEGDSYEN